MFRQFASREIINVAMVVTGFTIVGCILLYTFIKADLMDHSIRYEAALADTVFRSMRYSMLQSDFGSLERIIQNIGRQERVRYARIFQCNGIIRFSSDPEEVGTSVDRQSTGCVQCHSGSEPATPVGVRKDATILTSKRGGDTLSMMVPIPNDPDCSTGGCHYHPPEKILLGVLDVGISQETLNRSLSLLRLRMVIFCVMILILTVGGVTALLWRTVMLPLTRITDFAEARARGRPDLPPPRGTGDIRRLADAIERMEPGRGQEKPRRDEPEGGSG